MLIRRVTDQIPISPISYRFNRAWRKVLPIPWLTGQSCVDIRPRTPLEQVLVLIPFFYSHVQVICINFYRGMLNLNFGDDNTDRWQLCSVPFHSFFHTSASLTLHTFATIIMKNFGSILTLLAVSACVVSGRAIASSEDSLEARAPLGIGKHHLKVEESWLT